MRPTRKRVFRHIRRRCCRNVVGGQTRRNDIRARSPSFAPFPPVLAISVIGVATNFSRICTAFADVFLITAAGSPRDGGPHSHHAKENPTCVCIRRCGAAAQAAATAQTMRSCGAPDGRAASSLTQHPSNFNSACSRCSGGGEQPAAKLQKSTRRAGCPPTQHPASVRRKRRRTGFAGR